jgi:hypothetical protein
VAPQPQLLFLQTSDDDSGARGVRESRIEPRQRPGVGSPAHCDCAPDTLELLGEPALLPVLDLHPDPLPGSVGLSLALRHDALQPAGADGVEERLTVLEGRRAQQAFDVPWLRIARRCHGSRETRSAIERAGFIVE